MLCARTIYRIMLEEPIAFNRPVYIGEKRSETEKEQRE
jgi:hypothetical protein